MKFKTVKLIQVTFNSGDEPAVSYCFYNIDDAVDFVVTTLHEFNVDDKEWIDHFHVMKLTLNVKESDEH